MQCCLRFSADQPDEMKSLQEHVDVITASLPRVTRPPFPYPYTEEKLPMKKGAAASSSSQGPPHGSRCAWNRRYASREDYAEPAAEAGDIGARPTTVEDEPSLPQEIGVWAETIEESPLLVCEARLGGSSEELMEIMVHCFARKEEMSPHEWEVVILTGPKQLLMEKGQVNIVVCKRHGVSVSAGQASIVRSIRLVCESQDVCIRLPAWLLFFGTRSLENVSHLQLNIS